MSGWGTIYENMMYGLRTHSQALSYLQEQVSSGIRVIRPSDDPGSAFQIMGLHSEQHTVNTYTRNLDRVVLNMETASTSLQSISDELVRIKGDVVSKVLSETYTTDQRAAMANDIDSVIDSMVSIANREVLGQYLFGGNGTAAPYEVQRVDGRVVSVDYVGGSQDRSVPVGPGMQQPATLVGEGIFRCNQRQTPQFFGTTGATAGTGTTSVRGDVLLEVRHVATTYAGATGVGAGTDSAASDTILGAGHKLTIDVDAGTVALDDGSAVAYGVGGDDANIKLVNADGDIIYVDVTALDGGLVGTVEVDITSTGEMSIDGGTSYSPLTTFTANERVTDTATGRVLYVNATQMARVGPEAVRVGGTYDLFEMLISVRDALLNENAVGAGDQTTMLEQAAQALDEVMGGITRSSTSLGARLSVMDNLQGTLEDRAADLDMRTSTLQDADIIQVATELTRTQTYYEMILTATSKVLNLSLLDYL